jgi:voltage-gated potassium channel
MDPPLSGTIARTRTRLAAAKTERYGSVPTAPPRVQHSKLYLLLNSSSQAHGSVLFDRALLLLILANVYVDVMLTVDEWDAQHGAAARVFEIVSSLIFIAEYITRFCVAGERAKFRGASGRWRFVTSWASIVDLCSFVPWIAEKLLYWGGGDVPSTAYVRAFRVLRILKTDRFTGAADALGRVFYVNAQILGVAGLLAAMLVLFTASLLYYSGEGTEGFESIPATMYLSILMRTGQGEPDGELTTLLKSLCAFTAVFSVAMVAIPASMLTFGFEIEAQRLVLKRRERRLRRRIRAENLDNHWIESCSDSEDKDERFLARERRHRAKRRLCRGTPQQDDFMLSSSEEEYETLVLVETQDATLARVRLELEAKQAQYGALLEAMGGFPPARL